MSSSGPIPGLLRPDHLRGVYEPMAEPVALLATGLSAAAILRFPAVPEGIAVHNAVLRVCRHLRGPIALRRRAEAGEERLAIAPGDHFVMGPHTQARYAWDQPFETLSLSISERLCRRLGSLTALRMAAIGVQVRAADPLLDRLTGALLIEAQEGYPRGAVFADSVAAAVLAHLTQRPRGEGTETLSPVQFRRLRDAVARAPAGRVSLAALAAEVGIPARRLSRAFRAETGQTLGQWLLDQRLDRAEALLAAGDMPLAAVAAQVGFASQAHMTAAFRRLRGITPLGIRRRRPPPG